MTRKPFEGKRDKYRIGIMAILLAGSCSLTYYFHAVSNTGTVFTHFFYIPIILASLWWGRKGIFVALFLAAFLILSHIFLRVGALTANDYLRAVMFIIVALIFAILSERIASKELETELAYAELNQIFNTTSDGMRVVDKEFNVLRTNETFSSLSGVDQEEARGKKCYEVFRNPLCHTSGCPLTRILRGEEHVRCDVEKERKDGAIVPCILTAVPFRGPDGELLGIVEDFKDITERKEAEKALSESETKYRTIFETTGTATIIIEQDTIISTANAEFEKLSGYSKKEIEGKKSWTEFIVQDDLDRMTDYHQLRRVDPDAAPRTYEFEFIDRQRMIKDILGTFAMIPGTSQSVASFLDISERKRGEEALQKSEKQLRFLSSQLLTAQEAERKRIAQELHDDIGQILSAIKFGVEDTLTLMSNGRSSASAKALEGLIPLVQNGIEEVRRICMDLRPSILDDLGILATISWFCREFHTIYSGIEIETQISVQEDEVPGVLKTAIYRVLQEACNNIAKHSKADHVRLSLTKTDNTLDLTVEDNGSGFDLQAALSPDGARTGLGLASMKERTELAGGSFSIESTAGAGTTVRASWLCSETSSIW